MLCTRKGGDLRGNNGTEYQRTGDLELPEQEPNNSTKQDHSYESGIRESEQYMNAALKKTDKNELKIE
jgi:hypothetical protein